MQNKEHMTFLIKFLGCKVNSYEAEAVAESLLKEGYAFFDENNDNASLPNIIIINTCAVTENSVSKDKKMIKHYRKKYPNSILIVMGCYSQFAGEYVLNNLGADIVLGTSNRDKIINLINEYSKSHQKIYLHDDNNLIKKYENISLSKYSSNTRAYVKIQDGCNNFCTYCLIPYIRGRSRSRDLVDIQYEISSLLSNGYKEIVLTGIDMSSYGLDLEEKITFSDLIESILKEYPDLYRLRISSLEESLIDDKFLRLLKENENLANHLHIPLQSGSKSVNLRMNRKYDIEAFESKISLIRKIRPDISITTDVIVGFPGETEDDFMESYNVCKKLNFSKIHVFPYSNRKGTVASKMADQIDEKVKKERVHRLLELSDSLEESYASNFYGQTIEFLVEEYDESIKGFKGHSSNYLMSFSNDGSLKKGDIAKVLFSKENFLKF